MGHLKYIFIQFQSFRWFALDMREYNDILIQRTIKTNNIKQRTIKTNNIKIR